MLLNFYIGLDWQSVCSFAWDPQYLFLLLIYAVVLMLLLLDILAGMNIVPYAAVTVLFLYNSCLCAFLVWCEI